ncbi:MAG: Gldg family protein [Gammaproteobacteria bacterium]
MNQRRLISSTGLLLAALLALGVIILVNTTLTSFRLDLTENKLFTLSDGTINIVRSLDEPVTLDFYFSRGLLTDYPQLMNYATRVRDLLEEYAARSGGKLELNVIEPEPFSEAEDEAVANGLNGIAVNQAGNRAYLGLVGTNSTDDKEVIPFFKTDEAASLEYDVTKLIYNLANPDKRSVGIISSLPLFGGEESEPWAILEPIGEFFQVEDLGANVERIRGIDVLMVVHPKDLDTQTEYAIDQFLLNGGRAIFFVDPLAEQDDAQPDPDNPQVLPDMDSDPEALFETWGVEMVDQKLAADINAAMRVQTRGARGPQEIDYLPWLKLDESNLSREDFATSELKLIHMATAGILRTLEDAAVTMTPLIRTSTEAMMLERDLILFQRDPSVIRSNFESGGERLTLAARLSGTVPSSFPNGPPADDAGETVETDAEHVAEGELNAIVVADTDILADMFWTRPQRMFGIDVPQVIADNGDFVVNSLENLSGNTDLISLRSRGDYERPFKVVEEIRRKAEEQFRAREQELQAKLEETERKIMELQREGTGGDAILTQKQTEEIERFRQEQLQTRKELRAVQHELQKNIERLGNRLKFINIGLIPLLIGIIAVITGIIRRRRYV